MAFALVGNLSSPSMISLNIEIAFAADGDKIRLPIAEVLLRAAGGDLARSKKQRDWIPRNAVLLPPFLTEAAILHGESDAGELLKIFARSITEWASDADFSSEADEANDDNSVVTIEATEANQSQLRQSRPHPKRPPLKRPPSRRWPPLQTIATTSWPSSRPFPSNLLEFSWPHSPFACTSVRVSGSNDGQT